MATACKEILKKKIEDEFFSKALLPEEGMIKDKLTEIVTNMDKQIVYENKLDFRQSGCTFTLLLYFGGGFIIANIGMAHCLLATTREVKHGTSSRGNVSSVAGSDVFHMSQVSGGSTMTAKTATFATTNPTKAVAFLYRATHELTESLYGGRIEGLNLAEAKNMQMELLTTEHAVSNYDELLRLVQAGGIVCKDRKKSDLPYYARSFKLYDTAVPLESQGTGTDPAPGTAPGTRAEERPNLKISRFRWPLLRLGL